MDTITFKLFKNGEHVGFEIHKDCSYYNNEKYGIFHRKVDGIDWNIVEWRERFIEHDRKEMVCSHNKTASGGGIIVCADCRETLVDY